MRKIINKQFLIGFLVVIIAVAVSLLSFFVIADFATSPETYRNTIESIDDKKATVMGLTTASALASTGLATMPGDFTTPIADQILELSSWLLIVVCVLVLEKSLLTVLGLVSFKIIVPFACVLFCVWFFSKKEKLLKLSVKLCCFALVLVLMIPTSIYVGDFIYSINKETVDQLSVSVQENIEEETEAEEQSWLSGILSQIKDGVNNAAEKAQNLLNAFIDAIAIFLITYCVIPILVILVMIWFANKLFGVSIPEPNLKKIESSFYRVLKDTLHRKKENEIEDILD